MATHQISAFIPAGQRIEQKFAGSLDWQAVQLFRCKMTGSIFQVTLHCPYRWLIRAAA
jgi:hypothetical protein